MSFHMVLDGPLQSVLFLCASHIEGCLLLPAVHRQVPCCGVCSSRCVLLHCCS